jgi:parallel beta-helix repeat protein
MSNAEGIVLLNSQGTVAKNRVQQNDRCGLLMLSETFAVVEDNTFENNKLIGLEIRDPSQPNLRKNKARGN